MEWNLGSVEDFTEDTRKRFTGGGREIVVLRHAERFYAFENVCLHMGGPVAEGLLIGKVETLLDDNMCDLGDVFREDTIHLVCPWHGWEYDLETGVFAGNPRRKLRTYQTSVREGNVYVTG